MIGPSSMPPTRPWPAAAAPGCRSPWPRQRAAVRCKADRASSAIGRSLLLGGVGASLRTPLCLQTPVLTVDQIVIRHEVPIAIRRSRRGSARTDAPDADDGPVGLHRTAAAAVATGIGQPGAAAAGHGRGRWHAAGPIMLLVVAPALQGDAAELVGAASRRGAPRDPGDRMMR